MKKKQVVGQLLGTIEGIFSLILTPVHTSIDNEDFVKVKRSVGLICNTGK